VFSNGPRAGQLLSLICCVDHGDSVGRSWDSGYRWDPRPPPRPRPRQWRRRSAKGRGQR